MYYDFIGENLIELGTITYNCLREDDAKFSVLAIEFWNVLADIEKSRLDNIDQSKPLRGYINTAADTLIPLLLQAVVLYEEESEEWNLHKASVSTLTSMTQVIGDRAVDAVIGFV